MTLQTRNTVKAPATLTDEQRRRVSDALENAQSVNTRRNYAGQLRKFRGWCECEEQFPMPVSPEVVAAYAAELVGDGQSMSTIRLAVSVIVDAHGRVGQESPVNAGVTETLRGLAKQSGVGRKQARFLDADALSESGRLRSHLCDVRSRFVREHVHGVHHPTNVLAQSRQVARAPSMAMSLCRHAPQRAQRRPELSRTSCLQGTTISRGFPVPAAERAPGCTATDEQRQL